MKRWSPQSLFATRGFLPLLAVGALLFFLLFGLSYKSFQDYRRTETRILELSRLADAIRYLDEVLTMSARMGALTGDRAWESRYDKYVVELDRVLAEGERLFPGMKPALEETSGANQRLVEMERQSFELSRRGDSAAATKLLMGNDYESNKRLYAVGQERLCADIVRYGEALNGSMNLRLWLALALAGLLFLLLVLVLGYAFRLIDYRLRLEQSLGAIASEFVGPESGEMAVRLDRELKRIAAMARASYCCLRRLDASGHQTACHVWYAPGRPPLSESSLAFFAGRDPGAAFSDVGADAVYCPDLQKAADASLGAAGVALKGLGVRAVLGSILVRRTGSVFVLGLASDGSRMAWDDRDLPLLRTVAELLVRAVEAEDKEEELRQLATTDALTGVANRRRFIGRLADELLRCRRTRHAAALLLIDVDMFKQVNDSHGHAVGDQVLRRFCEIARGVLRDIDTLGRFGGDEFAVLLPESDGAGGVAVAERLRVYVEEDQKLAELAKGHITISVGVALVAGEDRLDRVLERADIALYAAKKAGRNRVQMQAAIPAAGSAAVSVQG